MYAFDELQIWLYSRKVVIEKRISTKATITALNMSDGDRIMIHPTKIMERL